MYPKGREGGKEGGRGKWREGRVYRVPYQQHSEARPLAGRAPPHGAQRSCGGLSLPLGQQLRGVRRRRSLGLAWPTLASWRIPRGLRGREGGGEGGREGEIVLHGSVVATGGKCPNLNINVYRYPYLRVETCPTPPSLHPSRCPLLRERLPPSSTSYCSAVTSQTPSCSRTRTPRFPRKRWGPPHHRSPTDLWTSRSISSPLLLVLLRCHRRRCRCRRQRVEGGLVRSVSLVGGGKGGREGGREGGSGRG